MRRHVSALVLMATLVAGCAGGPRSQPAAPAPVAPPAPAPTPTQVAVPVPQPPEADLTQVDGSRRLGPTEVAAGLESLLNDPTRNDPPLARLTKVISGWKYKYPGTPCFEGDLDGDGQPEIVAGLPVREGGRREQSAAVFVISKRDGAYRAEWTQHQDVLTMRVIALADFAGTGRPQILWSNDDHGAHTAYAELFVTTWAPGNFALLPARTSMSFAEIKVEGRDLVLHGGTAGSAGAGMVQRMSTDRLRLMGGNWVVVDRVYDASPLAYHRLLDGITAEAYGHPLTAENAYQEAMEPDRPLLMRDALEHPEQEEQPLRDAVRELARFRLGAFYLAKGRQAEVPALVAGASGPFAGLPAVLLTADDRPAACEAAAGWSAAHPEFITALNATFGYNSPRFSGLRLCEPL